MDELEATAQRVLELEKEIVLLKRNQLSRRDHFAMAAMQGYVCTVSPQATKPQYFYEKAAKECVAHADALIEELDR